MHGFKCKTRPTLIPTQSWAFKWSKFKWFKFKWFKFKWFKFKWFKFKWFKFKWFKWFKFNVPDTMGGVIARL